MFGGSFMNSWFDMNLSGHSGFQERLDILKAANVSSSYNLGRPSFVMFSFLFFRKFRLPIGLGCTIAAVSAQRPVEHVKNASQKYHD